jgi:hypothetical protein
VLDRIDRPLLEMWAETFARWHAARKIRTQLGMFDTGSKGQPRVAPWLRVEREAAADTTKPNRAAFAASHA